MPVPDIERQLHATIDDITKDVARLKRVQATKDALAPGDPRGTALADEAVEIASGLVPKAITERKIVDEATAD
jgi:hypothetical protein